MSRITRVTLSAISLFSVSTTVFAAENLPVPTFLVDSKLKPAIPSISGSTEKAPRLLARVSDARRHAADFVENELLVFSNDAAAVRSLASRWRGQIVSQAFFPKSDAATPPVVSLVAIDSSLADPSRLSSDVRRADPQSRGAHGVSSLNGLRTLAAAAHENASGIKVGVNYVFSPADLPNWSTQENGTSDAFQRSYLCELHHVAVPADCTQNMGVGAAWRALLFSGKLQNQVNVAIWDAGFAPNSDFPKYAQVRPSNTTGQPGPGSCGGQPCPFHGTNVASAGFAVPDNHLGDAGPGGALPNVHLDLISSPSLDLFSFFESLYAWITSLFDAQILNISAGIDIPSSVCLAVCTEVSLLSDALRALNILVVASAMNDGRDVDDRDCAVVCWEASKLLPCEFDNVLCIGGLDGNSLNRAAGSNYGSDSSDPHADNTVRLFAPFSIWMWDEHHSNAAGNSGGVYLNSGTSYSAPFVAGVAALVWAANPSLSAGEVEKILLSTATASPDPTVNRYVNALTAVRTALGNHVEPSIRIVAPSPNMVYAPYGQVVIDAVATEEVSGADLTSQITWQGSWTKGGRLVVGNVPPGNYIATASITVSGITSSASVAYTVRDYVPEVYVSLPSPANFPAGFSATLTGVAKKGPQDLSASIVWTFLYPGRAAVVLGSGKTAVLPGNLLTVPAGATNVTAQIVGEIPGARSAANIFIFLAHPAPSVTITTAVQTGTGCQAPSYLFCSGVVYASRVGANSFGVPMYQVNGLTLAGSAVDDHNSPIPPGMLTWYLQTPTDVMPSGQGFTQGNSWTGSIQFPIPPTSPIAGTASNPFLFPIVLRADDGRGMSGKATVTLKIVIR